MKTESSAFLLAASATLLFLVSGCGGGGGGGGSSSSSSSSSSGSTSSSSSGTGSNGIDYSLAVAASPLLAVTSDDAARAVTQDFTIAGGTLETTGADGSRYTLTIPADALPQRTRIRMTPLASLQIDDLPADGAWGVKFEPEGLQFFKPVSLTITPPAGVTMNANQQIPISIDGTTQVVSLAPMASGSVAANLQLMHFSSYALMFAQKGMNASLAGVRHRLGGAAEDRIASAMAERLAADRQKALLGQSEDAVTAEVINALRDQYVNEVLNPRLAAAGSSCAAGKLAWKTLLGYERQNALLGQENDPRYSKPITDLMADTLGEMTKVCMKEEYEICRDEHIITRILPAFLGVMRQAELMGVDREVPSSVPAWLDESEQRVRQCLNFELQFDSSVNYSSTGMPTHTMHESVSSRVVISYQMVFTVPPSGSPAAIVDTGALLLGNFVPLVASGYSVSLGEDCASLNSATAANGQLSVGMMGFVPVDPWSNRPVVADYGLSLAVAMNQSSYNYTQSTRDAQNNCANPTTHTVLENWTTEGWGLMGEAFASPDSGANITNWTVVQGGDILATKNISLSKTENSQSTGVSGTMVLFHKPLP